MNTEALFLAHIPGYDKSTGAVRIVRVANRAFTTKPSESPANTPYAVCLKQPTNIERSLFARAATRGRSTMALGDLELLNPDGDLDYLADLSFDTRTVTVYRSTKFNPSFPADFETFVLTMEQPEWDNTTITIKLRDAFYNVVNTPLQTNKYLGNNVLPDGLEGTSELTGKAKPFCIGIVKNVPAVRVNTDKLVCQVNDGAVHAIDAVYDRGVELAPGTVRDLRSIFTGYDPGTGIGARVSGVARGAGLYVAVGDGGKISTSPTGITWTPRTSPFSTGEHLLAVTFGGSQFVAVGVAGIAATSPDGVTWTQRTGAALVFGSEDILCVTYDDTTTQYLAAGTLANTIATSPDAVTWTSQTTTIAPITFAVRAANGLIVAAGSAGQVATSRDGVTWTARTTAVSDSTFLALAYGNGLWIAAGNPGPGDAATSSDGITWTLRDNFMEGALTLAIAYGGGRFTAVGGNGSIATSHTGLGWVVRAGNSILGSESLLSIVVDDDTGEHVIGGNQGNAAHGVVRTFADVADMMDDANEPDAGTFVACPSDGYFRLGSPPDGVITSDVTQGATSADRTCAALSSIVLARVPSSPTFDSGDLTALDADDDSELECWSMDDGVTCDQVLDSLAGTVGAAWYPDKNGAFRIARFEAPSGTPTFTIRESDIKRDSLKRITSNDQGNGIPIYQVVVQYGRFYQTITTDIAGAVSDAARAEFAQEWRNAVATDLSVLTAHPSAGILTIQSNYTNAADAQAEADRQLALRKAKRDPYEVTIELNDETAAIDLNQVGEIIHRRYSLSVVGSPSGSLEGGGLFRVLDVRPNAEAKELTLTVWGGARYKNLVDGNGAYVYDTTGAFIILEIAA